MVKEFSKEEGQHLKYEAILFDMDGTILNTLEDLTDAVNHVLRGNGESAHTIDEIRSYVGNGMKKLMERAVPGGAGHPDFDRMFAEYREYYPPHSRIKTKPYDGILPLMEECKARGVKVGIVSNKQQPAVTELAEYYFPGLTQAAIGDGEGRMVKPAPDACMEAMRQLGADPAKTLYVGDSDVDALTAKNSGLDCVLVTWGFRERDLLEQQEYVDIIDRPEELLKYI